MYDNARTINTELLRGKRIVADIPGIGHHVPINKARVDTHGAIAVRAIGETRFRNVEPGTIKIEEPDATLGQ